MSMAQCVYCPSNGDLPCIPVNVDPSMCDSMYACELDDGRVLFNLTYDECMYG